MTWDRLASEHFERATQYGNLPGSAAALASLAGYKAYVEAASFAPSLLILLNDGLLFLTQEQQRECVSLMADHPTAP